MNIYGVTDVRSSNVFTPMKSHRLPVIFASGLVVILTGCTFPSSRTTIPRSQANIIQRADKGVVTRVRQVNIEGQKSNLGLFGGGAMGGAAASGGRGVGGAIGQAAGAVTGAIVGQAVEEGVTRSKAQEITIRMDDGTEVVVTQESDGGLFQDGDHVRVLNSGRSARVAMAVD